VIELDDRIRALGERRNVVTIEMEPHWYGLDPVHLLRRHWETAWSGILEPWTSDGPVSPDSRSWRRWARLRRTMPEQWWLLGRELGRPQPAVRLADGTTIALY
jgi:hypothetical protein